MFKKSYSFAAWLLVISSGGGLYGYPSDSLANVWRIWLLARGGELSLTNFSPPGFFVPAFLLAKGFGEVAAYSFLVLLGFVSSFGALFFLGRRSYDRLASFLSALIFGSSLFLKWHGMQNLELVLGSAFLPLFVLALLKLEGLLTSARMVPLSFWGLFPNLRYTLYASLAFALVFLTSFQIGYLALIFAAGFFLFRRLYGRLVEGKPLFTKKIVIHYLLFTILTIILTLPGTLPLIRYYLGALDLQVSANIEESLTRNTILDLVAYGARPWDYFMPSSYHPVFGGQVKSFYQYLRENKSYQFWSPYLPERANYLTFTAVFLALYTLWRTLKKPSVRRNPSGLKFSTRRVEELAGLEDAKVFPGEGRKAILTFAFLAFFMFLVSMPALITVKGFNLYLPSYFLFKLFPMFRVYARAGVFVLFCVAVLAGYGVKFLFDNVRSKKLRFTVYGLLFALVIFENLNSPPFHVVDVSKAPPVYKWLRKQPGDLLIVEYPKDNSRVDIGGGCPDWLEPQIVRDWNPAYELFYQRIHQKELFGYDRLGKEERVVIGDLSDPGSHAILDRYGVDYVIVHTKDPVIGIHPWPYPQENPLDECWKRRIMRKPAKVAPGFKLIKEFDGAVVYKLADI